MTRPGVRGRPDLRHSHLAARPVDLDVGDTGHVAGQVFILRKADAAAAAETACLARLPARHRGDLLDHRPRPRVLHMREPERDRIGLRQRRHLVHEGFHREHIGVGAKRAQRRHADRHLRNEMVHDLLVREIVERDRHCGRRRRPAAGCLSARRAAAARPCTRPPARWCRRCSPAASNGCCSTIRTASRRYGPSAFSDALTLIDIAAPYGSQANSSSRIHCSRTGLSGTARASSAASSATSSAPFWP